MTLEDKLPPYITNLFVSTSLTIDSLELGKDVWIVYAHGKFTQLKKFKTISYRAFEQVTPNGTLYFSLYLTLKDELKQEYQICIDDINLNPKSKYRYTNHFVFPNKDEAEYYVQLCNEFNIHSSYELKHINN